VGYQLGVDLGTTYTAAAVCRDGHAEIVSLGNRTAAVPSVILLREDETILVGEAASRRGISQPDRVAREFKRRLGDTTPLFLGGVPYSAEALMGKLLAWVVAEVTAREGAPPDRVAVVHPANWGPYKIDLLRGAVRLADLGATVFLTEPQAAAVSYASQERVEPGSVVAVYDLGGGTFDAALLRKTAHGFEHLGQPEGIERLGGIDFDAAVFAHVQRVLGGSLDDLDIDDPTVLAALARLRSDCSEAKEALSVDSDTSLPVLLPNVSTEVRLTRGEFESMIRPALGDSLDALRRALRSAEVSVDEVSVVLLVGGSSRIPLVAQLVSAELGRPVAVDAHPKHAVALGAALAAAGGPVSAPSSATAPPSAPAAPPPAAPPSPPAASPSPPPAAPPPPPPPPGAGPAVASPPAPAPSAPVVPLGKPAATPDLPPTQPVPVTEAPRPAPPPSVATPVVRIPPPPAPDPQAAPGPPMPGPPPAPVPPAARPAAPSPPPWATAPSPAPPVPPPSAPARRATRPPARRSGPPVVVVVLGVVAVIAVAVAGYLVATRGGDDGAPLPAGCEDSAEFVCITEVPTLSAEVLEVPFTTQATLSDGGTSILFTWSADAAADLVAGGNPEVEIWASGSPAQFPAADIPDGATEICALVGDASLTATPGSGNCQPLPDGA